MNSSQAQGSQSGAPSVTRRRALGLCFAGWTVLLVVAVWWLFRLKPAGAPLIIGADGGSGKPLGLRMREWFELVRLNFYWAWGWVLLAPYVGWLGWRFHLEKGRLLGRVPVLLVAGAGFVWGSQVLTRQAASAQDMVVVASRSTMVEEISSDGSKFTRIVIPPRGMSSEMRNFTSETASPPVITISQSLPLELQQVLGSNLQASQASPESLVTALASNLAPTIRSTLRVELPQVLSPKRLPLGAGLDALAYVGLLGLAHAGRFYQRDRERGQQAILLSAQLNQVRLRALQAQLQPHFLFNVLNGIATLVRRDPAAAHEMLTSLSELLRLALSQSERQQIPLREEMEFLDRYIEIQQMRFGDRLRVEKHLEPGTLDCLVPALLLQPLVENAIRHGIEPSPEAGWVRIQAGRAGDQVVLSVEDDGAGLPAEGAAGLKPGVGLASVRERLETLYPGQHQFHLEPRSGGGVSVQVLLPFRVAEIKAVEPAPLEQGR